jgi:hypothetical protein
VKYQKSRRLCVMPLLCVLAMQVGLAAQAASDDTFTLSASAEDFGNYFPSYLANGYFSTLTGLRGTEGNLAYMVGFMDYAQDDMSRPAAIPGWSEVDYSTGDSPAGHFWMNQVAANAAQFADYRQTLNLQEATLTTHYRYVDHARSTQVKVTTFVSQASTHLAATQMSITPDFSGTVELSFALNLWHRINRGCRLPGSAAKKCRKPSRRTTCSSSPFHRQRRIGPRSGTTVTPTCWRRTAT